MGSKNHWLLVSTGPPRFVRTRMEPSKLLAMARVLLLGSSPSQWTFQVNVSVPGWICSQMVAAASEMAASLLPSGS